MASQRTARLFLLAATFVVAVCMVVPYGMWMIYPFQLVGTLVHEAGHALAAVGTGGTVDRFVVRLDTSGYVGYRGGAPLIATSAGYLASVGVGAALLMAGAVQKRSRATLLIMAAGLLIVTVVFSGYGASLVAFGAFVAGLVLIDRAHAWSRTHNGAPKSDSLLTRLLYGGGLLLVGGALVYMFATRGLVSWMVGGLAALALLLVATYASPRWQQGAVIFLGVQLALDGLNSIQTLWNLTRSGHSHNDAATMAELTGLPPEFWALTWGLLGVIAVGIAFVRYWRQ
ncbi:MAG: M50 family metallopeptidase [Longimonas sp.]|uniref:M50 family metallopeptidase n=1 Tax=Longimonas sp. TaxID=2039626 RepID=UPI00334461E0